MYVLWTLYPCKQLHDIGLPCLWLADFHRHPRIHRLLVMLCQTVRILEDHPSPHCGLKTNLRTFRPLYSIVQMVGKPDRSIFETSDPEVLLLYSYFAPHVRRLVRAFFPSKEDNHSEIFNGITLYAGSENNNFASASKVSDASEHFSRQRQTPLTARAPDQQKTDVPKKRRKPQGLKIAVNESLESGRRHRVNPLTVATGEATNLFIQDTR